MVSVKKSASRLKDSEHWLLWQSSYQDLPSRSSTTSCQPKVTQLQLKQIWEIGAEVKTAKIRMSQATLTYWLENGMRYIIHSWVVLVPHMKKICQIANNSQTWLKIWRICATLTFWAIDLKMTHHPLVSCICAKYEHNRWNRQWATEQTGHRGWMDGQTDGQNTPPPTHSPQK